MDTLTSAPKPSKVLGKFLRCLLFSVLASMSSPQLDSSNRQFSLPSACDIRVPRTSSGIWGATPQPSRDFVISSTCPSQHTQPLRTYAAFLCFRTFIIAQARCISHKSTSLRAAAALFVLSIQPMVRNNILPLVPIPLRSCQLITFNSSVLRKRLPCRGVNLPI